MSMSEKLYNLEQIAKKFFNKHIKSSDSGMPSKKFNKFRLYFLNIIIEVSPSLNYSLEFKFILRHSSKNPSCNQRYADSLQRME